MILSRVELTSKGVYEEVLNFDKELYKNNSILMDIKSLKGKVEVNYVSNLSLLNISLNGELVLRSTRTLKPVNYKLRVRDNLTITLTKLIKRDKNICHICGEKCNGKDFYYRDNIFIAGEDYPSVDHVKPIAKGGTHTWDNVKLAHRRCNSEKRDKLIYETTNEQLKFSI